MYRLWLFVFCFVCFVSLFSLLLVYWLMIYRCTSSWATTNYTIKNCERNSECTLWIGSIMSGESVGIWKHIQQKPDDTQCYKQQCFQHNSNSFRDKLTRTERINVWWKKTKCKQEKKHRIPSERKEWNKIVQASTMYCVKLNWKQMDTFAVCFWYVLNPSAWHSRWKTYTWSCLSDDKQRRNLFAVFFFFCSVQLFFANAETETK